MQLHSFCIDIFTVMAELSVAEQYYKEGKYLEACQAYDILLNDDPNNINLLQAQANCFMSLYQWHDCFQSILKAFQCSSWDLTLLNSFVANLVDKLNARRRGSMEKESIKDRQINEFEENLICEYCHQVFCNPVTFSCGHTFCKQCMLKSKKCLYCNNSIEKPEDVSVNVVLTTIIGNCFQAKMKAVKLRREGNEYFFDKKYEDALNKYTKALHFGKIVPWALCRQLALCQLVK